MVSKAFQVLFLISLMLIAGCRHYEPVSSEQPVRIALAPIISQTGVAQVVAPLSRNLHEQLNHDPGWKLVSEESSEAILTIEILGMNRDSIARDPADTGRPLSYYESLRIAVRWDSELPPPWGVDPVIVIESSSLIYTEPSLSGAESIAVTELADDLAGKILERLNWPADSRLP